jgi:hypothetical protein
MRSKLALALILALTLGGLVAGPSVAAERIASPQAPAESSNVTPDHGGIFLNMGDRAGAGIHTCPDNDCQVVAWATRGKLLYDYCYVTGEALDGNHYSHNVRVVLTGETGWINEGWLWTSRCPSHADGAGRG